MAITICDPLRMACNWVDSLMPPTTTEERTGRLAASLMAASLTCSASSRVGVRIRAQTPVGRSAAGKKFVNRQEKGKSFAGSCLRGGYHIAAFEGRGNRLRLHGSRLDKPVARQITLQRGAESEFRKFIHSVLFFGEKSANRLTFYGGSRSA